MKKVIITVSSVLAAWVSQAQEPVKLSLADATAYALAHNYSVKNAKLDEQIAQAQVKQTVAATLPHVNGKVEGTYFPQPQRQFIDASTFDPRIPKGQLMPVSFTIPFSNTATISASQLLFDGSVFVALKARNAVLELSQRQEAVSEETVRYNVLKAYQSLVIAYKQFELVKSTLGFARNMVHDMEVLRRTGFAEKIDADRSNVQLTNLENDSMRIANLLTVSEQALKFNLSMDINTPIVLTDTSIDKSTTANMALMDEASNYDRVPEFKLLQTVLRAQEYNLERYRMAALPTLAAFGAYGYNYGAMNFRGITRLDKYLDFGTVGLSLTVPIFNGLARTYQVREAGLNIYKAKNNIENLKLVLDFQTATYKTSLKNSLIQAQSQKHNLELSNSILELAQKKYKAGVGSNLEVTTAQTDLLRAQSNYFNALLDVTNAEADLKKAMGLLK